MTTKFVISPQFQMGARIFRVRINDPLLQELGFKAQLDDKQDLVRLAVRSNLSMFESLIHEMLHEAHYLCGDEDRTSEGKVVALAAFLAQGLASLGLEPDFSNIPKEEEKK